MHEPFTAQLEGSRRLHAWSLKQRGWSQRQIATAVGVSEGAVSQWMTRGREGGAEALYHRPPPGARCRLSDEQRARLPALLQRGPEAYGFPGQLYAWPHCRRDSRGMWRLLWSTSCRPFVQGSAVESAKAARRARQRDGAAIAPWREETWPAINRGRKPRATPPLDRRIRFLSLAQCRPDLCPDRPHAYPAGVVDA